MDRTRELIAYLAGFVTPRRMELFEKILARRTRYITVVLEDIYQPHNASAVLRSCDCFGIQDVHIIENRNRYQVNPDVALGASQWLSLHRYHKHENNTEEALSRLRELGYRLVATSPRSDKAVSLEDLPLESGKLALLFGTEISGLTDRALGMADEQLYIPMAGFTESFNISVSVAIILYSLTMRLRLPNIPWELQKEEEEEILLDWLRQSVKKSDLLIRKYLRGKR